jgi:hypothetical protein
MIGFDLKPLLLALTKTCCQDEMLLILIFRFEPIEKFMNCNFFLVIFPVLVLGAYLRGKMMP